MRGRGRGGEFFLFPFLSLPSWLGKWLLFADLSVLLTGPRRRARSARSASRSWSWTTTTSTAMLSDRSGGSTTTPLQTLQSRLCTNCSLDDSSFFLFPIHSFLDTTSNSSARASLDTYRPYLLFSQRLTGWSLRHTYIIIR